MQFTVSSAGLQDKKSLDSALETYDDKQYFMQQY